MLPKLVIYRSKLKLALLTVFSVLFAVLSASLVPEALEEQDIGMLLLLLLFACLFAACSGVLGLQLLIGNKEFMTISQDGFQMAKVWNWQQESPFWKWEDIKSIHVRRMGKIKCVAVQLHEPEKFLSVADWGMRQNEATGLGLATFVVSGVAGYTADDLANVMQLYWEHQKGVVDEVTVFEYLEQKHWWSVREHQQQLTEEGQLVQRPQQPLRPVDQQSSSPAASGRRSNYETFREQQLASLKTMTEEWVEAFPGQIPKDKYTIHLKFGGMVYEDLASVYLEGKHYQVHIDFRDNLYSRLLSRDLLASSNYFQEAVRQFSEDDFANTIYKVKPSRLAVNIDLMSYGTKEVDNLLHYVIVGHTVVVDVVFQRYFEKQITITVKRKEELLDGL